MRVGLGRRVGVFLIFLFDGAGIWADELGHGAALCHICRVLPLIILQLDFKEHFLARLQRHLRVDDWNSRTEKSIWIKTSGGCRGVATVAPPTPRSRFILSSEYFGKPFPLLVTLLDT